MRALTSTIRVELDDSLSADERDGIRSQWTDLIADNGHVPSLTVRGSIDTSVAVARSPHEKLIRDEKTIRAATPKELADTLTSEVTLGAIDGLRGEAVMLHAAAVALDDGRVVGLVGPSGRGKTTAARALGSAYAYVTDETLAIRPGGDVLVYPKPLSFGQRPDRKVHRAASELGLRAAPRDGLRLGALALLDRRPGIDRPYVESVPVAEALPLLIPETSYLAELENPLSTLAEVILATGGLRRIVYTEAETLPGLVEEILGTVDERKPSLTPLASQSQRGCDCVKGSVTDPHEVVEAADGTGAHSTYRRTDHTDALLVDDGLLVLRPHEVTVLEGVGPVIWLAADGTSERDLVDAAISELSEPPEDIDAAEVVSAALQQLVDARLLTRR
ncbi:ABC transporter ATP-binding protein [Agromyces ramosus]|uniref:ATP-binding cassette domain-containing protein n=1 Tax=Agromyces ramosus TaxID=33879 RepID=UPI0013EE4F54|nr:hypothetical protein [Agromyces ramosus]